MNRVQKRLYMFIGLMLFVVDRVTKYIALRCLATQSYHVNACLSFELVLNRGISWGLLHFEQMTGFVVVSLMICIVMCLLIWHTYIHYKKNISIIGQLLIISGALSNMIDRIWYGGVIDFILLHVRDWSWPLFNIADVSIVCGACMLIFYMVKE